MAYSKRNVFCLQTSGKVSWEKIKKQHAQNIRSTVHRTGDLIISTDINSVSDIATLIKDVGDATCVCPRKRQRYGTRQCRMHLCISKTSNLCTNGMSDVLRVKLNDRGRRRLTLIQSAAVRRRQEGLQ